MAKFPSKLIRRLETHNSDVYLPFFKQVCRLSVSIWRMFFGAEGYPVPRELFS